MIFMYDILMYGPNFSYHIIYYYDVGARIVRQMFNVFRHQ